MYEDENMTSYGRSISYGTDASNALKAMQELTKVGIHASISAEIKNEEFVYSVYFEVTDREYSLLTKLKIL